MILEVAHRLGLNEAFPWPDRYAYLDWLCEGTGMRFEEFREKDLVMGEMRYKKYEEEGFATPSRKFEFYSTVMERAGRPPLPSYVKPPLSPVSAPELAQRYPLILMTGTKNYTISIRSFTRSTRSAHDTPILS